MALGAWMREQARVGVGADALRLWAREAGFPLREIEGELAPLLLAGAFDPKGALAAPERGMWRCEGLATCLMWMRFPEMALFGGLAAPDAAGAIIAAATPRLSASLVARAGASPAAGRRSESVTFERGHCGAADALQEKIALLLGIDPRRFEPLQATRYGDGGFYSAHNDFFPEGHRRSGGPAQRACTVIVYLSDPASGGQTVIEPVGIRFAPVLGSALYFAYPDAESKEMTLHSSAICSGEKWIATQWIVEQPCLEGFGSAPRAS